VLLLLPIKQDHAQMNVHFAMTQNENYAIWPR